MPSKTPAVAVLTVAGNDRQRDMQVAVCSDYIRRAGLPEEFLVFEGSKARIDRDLAAVIAAGSTDLVIDAIHRLGRDAVGVERRLDTLDAVGVRLHLSDLARVPSRAELLLIGAMHREEAGLIARRAQRGREIAAARREAEQAALQEGE